MNKNIVLQKLKNASREISYIGDNLSDDNVTEEFKKSYKVLKSCLEDIETESEALKEKEVMWKVTYADFEKSEDSEGFGSFSLEMDGEKFSYEDVMYYPREGEIYANDIRDSIAEYPEGLEELTRKDFQMIADICTSKM